VILAWLPTHVTYRNEGRRVVGGASGEFADTNILR
jgi:hypothetical protein